MALLPHPRYFVPNDPEFDELMYSPSRHEEDEELAAVLLEFVSDSATLLEILAGLREDDKK